LEAGGTRSLFDIYSFLSARAITSEENGAAALDLKTNQKANRIGNRKQAN
jgi:hypothetical protein